MLRAWANIFFLPSRLGLEYAHYISCSSRGSETLPPRNGFPWFDTKLHRFVRLVLKICDVEYPLITIKYRSTLSNGGKSFYGSIYGKKNLIFFIREDQESKDPQILK